MKDKALRVRDGVIGAAIIASVTLGFTVNPAWFWLTGVIGVLLTASAVFGICFLYSFLGQCGLKNK